MLSKLLDDNHFEEFEHFIDQTSQRYCYPRISKFTSFTGIHVSNVCRYYAQALIEMNQDHMPAQGEPFLKEEREEIKQFVRENLSLIKDEVIYLLLSGVIVCKDEKMKPPIVLAQYSFLLPEKEDIDPTDSIQELFEQLASLMIFNNVLYGEREPNFPRNKP